MESFQSILIIIGLLLLVIIALLLTVFFVINSRTEEVPIDHASHSSSLKKSS